MSDSQTPPETPRRLKPPVVISQRPPSERIPGSQGDFPPRQPGQADPTRAYKAPPTQSAKRPPEPPSERGSGLVVPWWGFVLVILAVAGITAGLWGLVLMNRNNDSFVNIGSSPTPIFVVITSTPTLGPAPEAITATVPVIVPTQDPGAVPTDIIVGATNTVPAGPIVIGSLVEVAGTDGLGVKIRQGPGTTYSSFILGMDGDLFRVTNGPREADGYVWWEIVDPQDASRAGWAVQDFLQLIP